MSGPPWLSVLYPAKVRAPKNSSTVSVTATVGQPQGILCSPGASPLYPGHGDANDPIYVDDPIIGFPENILYRMSLQGSCSCIQDITWIQSPIYAEMLEDSVAALQSDRKYDQIASVWVAKVKIGNQIPMSFDSDEPGEKERWYVLMDGTPFHEYKSCMRTEEDMREWWTSEKRCREMEKKDMKYHKSMGVHFTPDQIPTPESLSRPDKGIVYRGQPKRYQVPVYRKIQDDRLRGFFLYKHIWTRTLYKYRAYYRVQPNSLTEMYRYGGEHVYFKSGRRLIGNPWHNRIPNEHVLGIPYDEGDYQRPCRLWQWYFDNQSQGWTNAPYNGPI